jgi:hypothetical protein
MSECREILKKLVDFIGDKDYILDLKSEDDAEELSELIYQAQKVLGNVSVDLQITFHKSNYDKAVKVADQFNLELVTLPDHNDPTIYYSIICKDEEQLNAVFEFMREINPDEYATFALAR